jgi:hypothetical protein
MTKAGLMMTPGHGFSMANYALLDLPHKWCALLNALCSMHSQYQQFLAILCSSVCLSGCWASNNSFLVCRPRFRHWEWQQHPPVCCLLSPLYLVCTQLCALSTTAPAPVKVSPPPTHSAQTKYHLQDIMRYQSASGEQHWKTLLVEDS